MSEAEARSKAASSPPKDKAAGPAGPKRKQEPVKPSPKQGPSPPKPTAKGPFRNKIIFGSRYWVSWPDWSPPTSLAWRGRPSPPCLNRSAAPTTRPSMPTASSRATSRAVEHQYLSRSFRPDHPGAGARRPAGAAGAPLFTIDDSVQRANHRAARLQAEAALALLRRRSRGRETLAIRGAGGLAESNLKAARDQYDKDRASYDIDPKSISKDVLDTAEDAVNQAAAALDVARKQYELTKAGRLELRHRQPGEAVRRAQQAYEAANALLQNIRSKRRSTASCWPSTPRSAATCRRRAPMTPTPRVRPARGDGPPQDHLAVRCYVDEILVSRLPSSWHIRRRCRSAGPTRHQGAAGVRPGAALCFAQDRAVQRAPGAGGPAGAAGDFPVREKGHSRSIRASWWMSTSGSNSARPTRRPSERMR
jgi:hypothetical protein